MTKKNALQVVKHAKHEFPKVSALIYRAFESRDSYAVQFSYGAKPDYVTVFSAPEWKTSKGIIPKE